MGGREAATMVGRGAERQRIVDVLAAGLRGEPSAVVVRGEAGIGKTRLVNDVLAGGPPAGSLTRVIAIGQCVDLGSIGSPFTPIRRLLRDLYSGVGDEAFRTAAATPAVVATLARFVPQLADAGLPGPDLAGDDYLAEAIERVIEVLSATHHLVLVIEDLHWADSASITLLHTLAATLRGTHVTIIMTVRSGEVGRGHPLREALAEMERSRAVTMVDVPRLTADEVAAQARSIVGADLDPQRVAALVARADGVPFFVEELVEVDPADLPPTLRDVTLVRVDRLGEAARTAVRLAAVGGVEVPASVLEGVWRTGPDDLAQALREAVEADVLVARNERYTFRHALIREAVHDDLTPTESAGMHRRYAEYLQSRLDAGEDDLAALASEHWLATHDSAKAFAATLAARLHALETSATESAAELGERLVTLWPAVPDAAERVGSELAALRVKIAEEYRAVHRVRACLRVIDDALEASDPDDVAARVPLELLYLTLSSETERTLDDHLHRAEIERLLDGYDGPHAGVLKAQAAAVSVYDAPESEQVERAETALALAEATDDRRSLLEALRRRSRVALNNGDFEGALTYLERASGVSAALSDDRWWIANNTVCAHLSLGDYDSALAYGEKQVTDALDAGRERAIAPTLSNMAEGYIAAGRLEEGLAAARRARALSRGDSTQFTLNSMQVECIGLVWADRLSDAEALLEWDDTSRDIILSYRGWRSLWAIPILDIAVARARDARPKEAVDILLSAGTWIKPDARDGIVVLDDAEQPMVAASAWLAALRTAGAQPPEDVVADARSAEQNFAETPWWETAKAMTRAHLAATSGADAVLEWRHAVAAAERRRCPVRYLWISRFELGRALRAAGQRDEGTALLRQVSLEATAAGAALVARWAREELGAGTRVRSQGAGPFGELTPREFEVLELIAQGLTNGEIGERLFISSKTASVHVSAILAKVGAANRAEAAAYFVSSVGR